MQKKKLHLLFLISMSSRQLAGCFIPVQEMNESTVSLKQLCTRYDRTMLWMSLSLMACKWQVQINPKEIKYATLTGYKDTLTSILAVSLWEFFMVTAHRHKQKSVTVPRTFPLSFPMHTPLAKPRRHFPIIGQALRWHKCSSKSQPNTDR